MKRISLALTAILAAATVMAQNNVHYEWMEGNYRNPGHSEKETINPRTVNIPGIPGYNAYTADLHMHTYYSDAEVSPKMRVYEAVYENLDILAITDHHPYPRTGFDQGDRNKGFDEAAQYADELGLKLIKGFEITGREPIGHINVLFVKELNDYKIKSGFGTDECDRILAKARAEGAFITTNHPGWPDQNSDLSDYITGHITDGTIHGIEVFNGKEFYPLAIDHASKYGLAMLATTDSHYPMAATFENRQRNTTIIFAKDKSDEALKEALNAGRTLAWSGGFLSGKEQLMREFLHACIKVVKVVDSGAKVRFRLFNSSSIDFYLTAPFNPQESILIPAGGYAETKRFKKDLADAYTVTNMYIGSTEKLVVPLSFLLQGEDVKVCSPNIAESSISFSEAGLSFRLSTNSGSTYYTLDGSVPTAASTLYDGGTITVGKPCTIKAVTISGGSASEVYERQLPYCAAVKCKARKHGLNYTIYENDDILSTRDIVKIGKVTGKGTKLNFNINERVDCDHFGYIFTGVIDIPADGKYRFILNTNDGSDLTIDDILVVDNDSHVGWVTAAGYVYLQKGTHRYTVRYFEGYGGESFELQWQQPGALKPELIPAEVLYLE